MRYKAHDAIEGLRYGAAVPPIPKPPLIKGPSFEEVRDAYHQRLGPFVDPRVVDLLARNEFERTKHVPPLELAARVAESVGALPQSQFLERASHAFGRQLAPIIEKKVGPVQTPSTGSPRADAVADFLGSTSSTAATYAAMHALTGGAGAALGKVPALAKAAQVAPPIARAAARGAATQAMHTGLRKATGHDVTAKDLAKNVAFGAGANVGSLLGGAAAPHVASLSSSPAVQTATDVALRGAAAGLGGGLARQPFDEGTAGERVRAVASDMVAMTLFTAAATLSNPQERQHLLREANRIRTERSAKAEAWEGAAQTLGLSRMPQTEDELKQAFRAQVRRAHPDTGGSTEEYQQLVQARDIARQQLARAKYNIPKRLWDSLIGVFNRSWAAPSSSSGEQEATQQQLIPAGETRQPVTPMQAPTPTPASVTEPAPPAGEGPPVVPAPVAEPQPSQEPVQYQKGDWVQWARPVGEGGKHTQLTNAVVLDVTPEGVVLGTFDVGNNPEETLVPVTDIMPDKWSVAKAEELSKGHSVKLFSDVHITMRPDRHNRGAWNVALRVDTADGVTHSGILETPLSKDDAIELGTQMIDVFRRAQPFQNRYHDFEVAWNELHGMVGLQPPPMPSSFTEGAEEHPAPPPQQPTPTAHAPQEEPQEAPQEGATLPPGAPVEAPPQEPAIPESPVAKEPAEQTPPPSGEKLYYKGQVIGKYRRGQEVQSANRKFLIISDTQPSNMLAWGVDAFGRTAEVDIRGKTFRVIGQPNPDRLKPDSDWWVRPNKHGFMDGDVVLFRGKKYTMSQTDEDTAWLRSVDDGQSQVANVSQYELTKDPDQKPKKQRNWYEEGLRIDQASGLKTPAPATDDRPLVGPKGEKLGKVSVAKTDAGTEIKTQLALVEASDLVTSHDFATMSPNPLYPQELQPRDRTREATRAQMGHILAQFDPRYLGDDIEASGGAPIVNEDLVVESGNVRSMVLAIVHSGAPSLQHTKYIQFLKAKAPEYGLNPYDIDKMKAPVLVRIRKTDVDPIAFTSEANVSSIATMSATEQAMTDAQKLTGGLLARFTPREDGEILTQDNRDFIADFMREVVGPSARASYVTSDGTINQDGVSRIRNAIFARAYGDPSNLEKLAESTDNNIRNISRAMLVAAPRYASVQERIDKGTLHPLSLAQDVAAAANQLAILRRQGKSVKTFLGQTAMFEDTGLTPEGERILELFEQYGRSGKRLAMLLNASVDAIEAAGVPGQTELFGGSVVPTKMEIVEVAVRKVAREYGEIKEDQAGLFEASGEGQETAGKADGGRDIAPQDQSTTGQAEGSEPEITITDPHAHSTSAQASTGGYRATAAATVEPRTFEDVEPAEMVVMFKELSGHYPIIAKQLRAASGGALGEFTAVGKDSRIKLRADIFLGEQLATGDYGKLTGDARAKKIAEFTEKVARATGVEPQDIVVRWERNNRGGLTFRAYNADPTLWPKVFAHEFGHFVDYLPDHTLQRGNILGHVASLKKWMKTTIGELPDTPDQFLTAKERAKLSRQAAKEAGDNKEAATALYRELVAEAIKEKKLVTRDAIMNELKRLTQLWRPFNEESNPVYTRYRHAPTELYADAVSVLFNDRQLLEEIAPNFAKMFRGYLERKPEFNEALKAFQEQLGGNQDVKDRRLLDMWVDMLEKAPLARAQARVKSRPDPMPVGDWILTHLSDNYHVIRKMYAKHLKSSDEAVRANAKRMQAALDESLLTDNRLQVYFHDVNRDVLKPLEEAGVSFATFNTYLGLTRVAKGDRGDIANPLGTDKGRAERLLAMMEKDSGPETFAVIKQAAEAFRRVREEIFLPYAEESRAFSKEAMENLWDNKAYTRFEAIEHFGGTSFGTQTLRLFHQLGYMGEMDMGVEATVLQDMSYMVGMSQNNVRRQLRDFMRQMGEEIIPAQTRYSADIKGMKPEPPSDPNLAVMSIVEDGKRQYYYVDRFIVEALEDRPAETNLALDMLNKFLGVQSEIFAGSNPGWQAYNLVKGFLDSVQKLPEIKSPKDAVKLAAMYPKVMKEAWRFARHGEMSSDIKEGLLELSVRTTSRWQAAQVQDPNERAIQTLAKRFAGEVEEGWMERVPLLKAYPRLIQFLRDAGTFAQVTGDMAGREWMRQNRPDIDDKERSRLVRHYVQTPTSFRRARSRLLGRIFLFYNSAKEGIRTTGESAKEKPVAFLLKMMLATVIPKLTLEGIRRFAPESETAKVIEKVNPYHLKHYNVIPLWLTADGKDAVYITLPVGFSQELIGSVVYDLITGKVDEIAGDVVSQSPFNLNPAWDLSYKAYQIFVKNQNAYDAFYGTPVLSREGETLKGAQRAKEFGRYAWNAGGGSTIYKAPTVIEAQADERDVQKLLRLPGFNVVGKFIKVSRAGDSAKTHEIYEDALRRQTKATSARRRGTIEGVGKKKPYQQIYAELVAEGVIDPENTSLNQFKTQIYDRHFATSTGDPWVRAFFGAIDSTHRQALLAEMPDDSKAVMQTHFPDYDLVTGRKRTQPGLNIPARPSPGRITTPSFAPTRISTPRY